MSTSLGPLLPPLDEQGTQMPMALIPKRSTVRPREEDTSVSTKPGRAKKKTRRGCAGAGARKRNQESRTSAWQRKVMDFRNQARSLRSAEGISLPSVLPSVHTRMHTDLYVSNVTSEYVMDFYYANAGGLKYLEVHESANVSNLTGLPGAGRGVFATEGIVADKLLCPYVGRGSTTACPASVDCGYCLCMHSTLYVCARDVEYDIAYLMYADEVTCKHCLLVRTACPPNYARYINTVMHGVEADFNCEFRPTPDGLDCMLVYSTRDIEEGSELLIDYGSLFTCL